MSKRGNQLVGEMRGCKAHKGFRDKGLLLVDVVHMNNRIIRRPQIGETNSSLKNIRNSITWKLKMLNFVPEG